MTAGILGEADLLANTPTRLFTVPVDRVTTVTVSFCNRSNQEAKVTLRTPLVENAQTSFFEYETPLPPKGVLDRSGIAIEAGRHIVVVSSVAGVTAIAHGFGEEA